MFYPDGHLSPYLSFSYLHKNSKVCQMITGAHHFWISFVDQRASSTWPRTVESTPAQMNEKNE